MDRDKAIILGVIPKDTSRHYKEDGILFAVVGELLRYKDDKQKVFLSSMNLTTPEGIAKAQRDQAVLEGIENCITLIEGLEKDGTDEYNADSSDDGDLERGTGTGAADGFTL